MNELSRMRDIRAEIKAAKQVNGSIRKERRRSRDKRMKRGVDLNRHPC